MLLSLTLYLGIAFSIKYNQLECAGFGHTISTSFPGNSMLKIHALLKMQGFLMILFGCSSMIDINRIFTASWDDVLK